MSTRDEILAALTDHPDGLTSKELAPFCPACECDPQIVARMVAQLRTENVIHAGTELRDGGAIWIFGKAPEPVEAPVERVTLPEHGRAAAPQVSEAARAIAAMRQGSAGAPRPRQPAAPQATAPQQASSAPKEGATMSTIRDRIESVLREHGPMDTRAMRKHGLKNAALGQYVADLLKRKLLVRLGGGPRSGVYGLPGQKLGEKSAPPPVTEPSEPREPKGKRAKKASKGPKVDGRGKWKRIKYERAKVPPAPPAANGEPAFGINEQGELGIEHQGAKVRLDAGAFARLREFITKTEPVWAAQG